MSTFPVKAWSDAPEGDPDGFGITTIEEPAVIIKFNDSEHGFTLPATTFAGITYMDGKVSTIRTSPMLRKIPFSEAFDELARLQNQLKASGWRLNDDGTNWFDLTPTGRMRLHEHLRNGPNGQLSMVSLVVPEKYSLYLMIRCASRCDSSIGLDRYLIEISVGADSTRNKKPIDEVGASERLGKPPTGIVSPGVSDELTKKEMGRITAPSEPG